MAFDVHLSERIRLFLQSKKLAFSEKKMMGGLCFMVNDKMCMGVVKNRLMARVGKENYEMAMQKPGSKPMDFTGTVLSGYVFVLPEAIDMDADLEDWLNLCLAYNPIAKSSKKKR